MYSEQDLEAAVAAGALSRADAQALRNYVAAARQSPAVDEEHFRLITGFNDFFVSIAAAILLFAVAWIGNEIPPHVDGNGPSPFAGLFVAGAAWGLAEFFTRQRRMALPSILLLLAFVGGVFGTVLFGLFSAIDMDSVNDDEAIGGLIVAASAAVAAGGAWLHWRRFHVPITVAAGAAAGAGMVLGLLASIVRDSAAMDDILLFGALILGIGVFVLAMRWDASDPRRETRRSDVAFWLHLLAAPLIVHPIFSLLGLSDGNASVGEAVVVLIVYVVLGLAALAVDRRALLVSALAYVLFAMSALFREAGAVELSIAFTALVIGSALLLLSAFWHNVRAAIVTNLPGTMQARLPARA